MNRKYIPIIALAVVLISALMISRLIGGSDSASDLRKFSHGFHTTEAGVECQTCHQGIAELAAGQRSMPGHKICSDCHEVDNKAECGKCHSNPDNPTAIPAVSEYYLAFSHKTHTANGLQCSACHGDVASTGMQPTLTDMQGCMACHRDRNGSLECEKCHQGGKPRPLDHMLVTWQADHGLEASSGAVNCAQCHDQSSCDACHQGVNLSGSPHPPTWKFNHFAESSYGGECLVCHETHESCTTCHRAIRPIPHPLGPAYADREEGGAHVADAEAFIETCFSCHDVVGQDPTCAKCHG
jgi:hypothetical protein